MDPSICKFSNEILYMVHCKKKKKKKKKKKRTIMTSEQRRFFPIEDYMRLFFLELSSVL
jgi:hypothetical protein